MVNNYDSLIHQSAGPRGEDAASRRRNKNCYAIVQATLAAFHFLPTEAKVEFVNHHP